MKKAHVLAGLLVASSLTAQDRGFTSALEHYRACMQRPSLWMRTEGREVLAQTRDPRAFDILQRDYRRPEEPSEFVRALIVSLLAENFATPEFVPLWTKWRAADGAPRDVWLWYHALRIEADAGCDTWCEVLGTRKPVELRVAALAAGRRGTTRGLPRDAGLDILRRVVRARGDSGHDRELLMESGLAFIDIDSEENIDEAELDFLRDTVAFMALRSTSARCRLTLSRSLSRILKREDLGPDAEAWRTLLDPASRPVKEIDYARRVARLPRTFFGATEYSRNICYLIDASDSMLAPLTPNERDDLMPLTGELREGDDPRPDRPSARAESAIDWSRVITRFDAARELLKLSVAELGQEQRFAIVLFGIRAETLKSTPTLVAPTHRKLVAVTAELDAIQAEAGDTERPLGTLRGETNLHGAFRAAFRLTTRQPVDGLASIDERGFRDGCDTIYLLSDGDPNWDDFEAVDKNEDGKAADLETGRVYDYDGPLIYFGPFSTGPRVVTDLERMNLLRRVKINTMGIGEADDALLAEIAGLGHGRMLRIGKRSP
jgi:hypothetical protein